MNNNRIIAILLFLIAMSAAAWFFSDILIYMFIAIVLAILGTPLVNLMMKIKYKKVQMPISLAALITMLVMLTLFVLFFRYFVPLIVSEIQQILSIETNLITDNLYLWMQKSETILKENGFLLQEESLSDIITVQMKQLLQKFSLTSLFGNIIQVISGIFIGLFSVLFMTFFSLKDNQIFFKLIRKLIPVSYRDNFANIVQAIKKQLVKYFSGVFIEMLIVGSLEGLLCYILGVPNPLLIGFLGGLLNIIPYVGTLIALALSSFIALAGILPLSPDSASISMLLIKVISAFAITKLLDDFVLQPIIYGKSVHAHPLEIFIVILVAGHVGGVLGMIFAVPAYSLLRIILKEFFSQYYSGDDV